MIGDLFVMNYVSFLEKNICLNNEYLKKRSGFLDKDKDLESLGINYFGLSVFDGGPSVEINGAYRQSGYFKIDTSFGAVFGIPRVRHSFVVTKKSDTQVVLSVLNAIK